MFEDFEQEERYEKPDYEIWEERQLDLDRDAGEFDFLEEEDDDGR